MMQYIKVKKDAAVEAVSEHKKRIADESAIRPVINKEKGSEEEEKNNEKGSNHNSEENEDNNAISGGESNNVSWQNL